MTPPALATLQQALVAAIWQPPGSAEAMADAPELIAAHAQLAGAVGLSAYQGQVAMLAPRVLGAAFPVLARVLGEERFAAMARAHWQDSPPTCGDLAQWGHALPHFLQRSAAQAQQPWLADLAQVEWALHAVATAPDAMPQPGSLALLVGHAPHTLRLALAPGSQVVPCDWGVAEVMGGAPAPGAQPQAVVVWRCGFKPRWRECLPGEAAWLAALLAGRSLGEALDCAPALDFSAWLTRAVPDQLLIAATRLET